MLFPHCRDRGKAMDESIAADKTKQNRQKPPLSAEKIAGEILAGAVTGLVALLVVYGAGIVLFHGYEGEAAVFLFLGMFIPVSPPLYILGTAVGVYLVGRIGKQTGSFWATLGGVLLGVPVIALLYLYIDMAGDMMLGAVKIVLWALVFLAPAIMATLGFNLTRRYKKPPSS
jgi:hypothetical protein